MDLVMQLLGWSILAAFVGVIARSARRRTAAELNWEDYQSDRR
jgi:hypothetical protein